MKPAFLVLLCAFLSFQLEAQGQRGSRPGGARTIQIKGQVFDEDSGMPLEYATVSFYSKRDSSLTGGGLTDELGEFKIETRAGRLYGLIEFLGYSPYYLDPIPIDFQRMRAGETEFELDFIYLSTEGVSLTEVEVRAEKSETIFALDKKIFNVGKDLANRGGTAEEVLDNVPSVTVDIEGNVSLRGSTGVRILVDGKPSGLTNNANGLRSIPANTIETIEVITNPSARYEAEGMAGIINIVLKKNTKKGFNGAFEVSTSYPLYFEDVELGYGIGANLNYRKGAINWFLNYGLNLRNSPGGGFTYQETYTPNQTLILDQTRRMNRSGLSNGLRAGFDYYLTERQVFTGAFNLRLSDEDNNNVLTYKDFVNSISEQIGFTERNDFEFEDETRADYSINYSNQLSSNRNHKLELQARYSEHSETEGSDFTELINDLVTNQQSELNQYSGNAEADQTWLFQADFTRPFTKDHKYEIGLRTSLREISNDYEVGNFVNDVSVQIDSLSDNFLYDEDVIAAYGTYGNKHGIFSYQLGIRTEMTVLKTSFKNDVTVLDTNYVNLFPSGFFSFDLGGGHALQTSYSRRIRRPRFRELNPFFTFSDNRNTFRGNPGLLPEFTDSYEINHLKQWDKANLSSGIFYRHTTDGISRIREQFGNGNSNTFPVNASTNNDLGLDVNFSFWGIPWLRLDGNITAFQFKTEGTYQASQRVIDLGAEDFTYSGRLTSRFTFWKGSNLQLRANYRGPRNSAQGERESITSIDLGWSKDFFKRRLTLTLSARDIFNGRKRRYIYDEPDFFVRGEFQWRGSRLGLTASYRINQSQKRSRSRNRNGGSGGQDFEGGEF